MKNLLIIFAVIFLLLINISCEENFSPKAEFNEQYILNCVLGADSSIHYATLSRTYDVPGFNPEENRIDPAITGADIKLISRGVTYSFRDTSTARPDTSRYKDDLDFYYLKDFIPHTIDSVEIIAVPKAGVTLTSKIRIPPSLTIFTNLTSVNGAEKQIVNFRYDPVTQGFLYNPRLYIVYSLKDEVPVRRYKESVPLYYNGNDEPVYPGITNSITLSVSGSTVEKAVIKLTEGKSRGRYKIIYLELEVLSFEEHLSGYISSASGFIESLSIRLDQINYTNINGGLGVFGSYLRALRIVPFDLNYLSRLGFTQ